MAARFSQWYSLDQRRTHAAGDVIAIPDEDMLGIILEIRGLQTIIRDLVRGHDIEVPNSTLLKCRVDFYKENPGGVFRDFVDFKIGYDLSRSCKRLLEGSL